MKSTSTGLLVWIACASMCSVLGQERRLARQAVPIASAQPQSTGCLHDAKLNVLVNPRQVRLGESSTITWDVLISDACGPVTIELDRQVVQESGTKTIVPTQSRNVTLTVSQSVSGKRQTVTKTAAINVQPAVPCVVLD